MREFLHTAFYINLLTILVHSLSFGKEGVIHEELNWIEITDAASLAKIGSTGFPLDGNYLQTQDIDLSEFSANEGWKRIGGSHTFNGTFDGQGYTIRNLTINRGEFFQGLFGYVGPKGVLKRIRLTNVSIQIEGSNFYNGALVGQNSGHIINCAVIDGELSAYSYSGGLVGYNNETGKIEQSYSGINVSGTERMGGLVGVNVPGGLIINSYAQGRVIGKKDIGGLVGWNRQSTVSGNVINGSIINCYSSGQINAEINAGGLLGLNDGEVKNSYWNIETSNQSSSAGKEEGKRDAEMKLKSTFIDWDFDNIWQIKEGESMPFLKSLEVNIEIEKEIPALTFTLNGLPIDPENIINCPYGDVLNFHVESTSDGDLSDLKFEISDTFLLDISLFSAIKAMNVGSAILKVIQPETDLYDSKEVHFEIVVAKRRLLISPEVGQYKIYGDVDPELTFRVMDGDLIEGDIFEGELKREKGEDAGSYIISEGTLNAGPNYTLVFEGGGQFVIKQAESKITTEPIQVHAYDGTAKEIIAHLNHNETELTIEPIEPFIKAGVYELEIFSKETRNFLEGSEKVSLTIEKAVLTVTADKQTSIYGNNNPFFTFNYQGFKGEDDEKVLIDLPKVNSMVATTIDIGEYPIIPFGAKADNYNFKYVNGLLTVIPAKFENISLEDQTFVYNGQPHNLNVSTLPKDVTVVYENNEPVNAGVYEVKATFSKPGHVNQVLKATLTIKKASQTISFEEIGRVSRDIGQIELKANSNMGVPIRFFSDDNLVATLNGDNLLVHRLGIVRVTASQEGDDNHEAALPVTIQVQVEDRAEGPVRVHQALSPNGDGVNDFLILEGIKEFPENRLRIISRTGMVVFDIEGYDNETKVFNGISNTQTSQLNLSDGTYFYVLQYKNNEVWHSKKGWIFLKDN